MNLHWMSPIGFTGYGYAALNTLKALDAKLHNIGLTLIGQPHIESEIDAALINKCVNQTHLINYEDPCLKIWHQFDLITRPGRGKYYVFPFFETDILSQKDIYHLKFADHIFVASEWAKNILTNNQIDSPITVVPLGVDRSIFDSELDNSQNNANYIFASIGKWEKRKGHDTLIDSFNRAFESNDNVELWLLTHNPFLSPEEEAYWIGLVDQSKLKNKIRIFPRIQTHKQLAEIISYTNCGVYLSRAEGWNLELLETMAMNKPVIATNYSAHTEYCNQDNCLLVDISANELAIDNKWFFGTSNWASLEQSQIDQIIHYMQKCYNDRLSKNNSGLETAKRLSWENTANIISGCISM